MKKFLCYLALIILVVLIALPPMLRAFYKEEEDPVLKDKIQLLMCSKETYNIASSYRNGVAINIKYQHLVNDANLENYTDEYALEYTLDANLKEVPSATRETIKNDDGSDVISYFLVYETVESGLLGDFSNYRLLIEEQKQSYTNQGYTCSIIE